MPLAMPGWQYLISEHAAVQAAQGALDAYHIPHEREVPHIVQQLCREAGVLQ